MYTISIVACRETGSTQTRYALAGRHVHRGSAGHRFDSVADAATYATRHGYTVTSIPMDVV